jgi:EAL domain-containing protein (putative c-di-GMP-specific phosphodiesterase class I)
MASPPQDLVRSYRAVSSGALRILSIEALKAQLGAKWEMKVDQMKFLVESIIRRHLQRGQTFYQATDSTYVIVFDFDADERAEFICRAISREIVGRLLGSAELKSEDDPAIEMRIASVPADQVQGGRISSEAFDRHFANAAPQLVSSKDGGVSALDVAAIDPQPPSWDAPQGKAKGAGADDTMEALNAALLDWLREVEDNGAGVASAASAVAEKDQKSWRFEFRYQPLWSAGSNAFLCHRIEARARFDNQPAVAVEQLAQDETGQAVLRAFDRAVLAQALRDSRRALDQGCKYVAVVPLHAASLASDPDRQWILATLQGQPEPLPKLVVLELIDSEVMRWTDLTRHVWGFHKSCRRIVLRQGLDHLPWFQSQHLPPQAIGVSAVVPHSAVSEQEIIERMDRFTESARKRQFETYLYGLRSRSLAFAAIGAGFTHVSGDVIAPTTHEVGRVALARLDTLFSRPRTS